jgi:hypothetical protein
MASQPIPKHFEPGFLAHLDGRESLTIIIRQRYDQIISDLGGIHRTTHLMRSLIERFVWLEHHIQLAEAANPGKFDQQDLNALNALLGLANRLGVEARDKFSDSVEDAAGQQPPRGWYKL